jgi:hypothetical protein
MVEEGPRFHLGRFKAKIIELIENTDFEETEFIEGDLVVVFHAEDFKKWYDDISESINRVKCPVLKID